MFEKGEKKMKVLLPLKKKKKKKKGEKKTKKSRSTKTAFKEGKKKGSDVGVGRKTEVPRWFGRKRPKGPSVKRK